MTIYQAPTDEVKKIELPSAIQQVLWTKQMAAAGAKAAIEVYTRYVGSNSDLEIELSDHSGKKHGTIKSKISGNYYSSQIEVPIKAEKILYANVKLPKHSLEMKSNPLLVLPPIEITNLKWDKKEARRGDIVKLTADIKEVATGTEAEIEIYEHDADGAHDLITKFPVTVKNNKIELDWEYEYHEDTDDIPTEEESEKGYNPPEYFFRIKLDEIFADSELLEFKDWIELVFYDVEGNPAANVKVKLKQPDGEMTELKADHQGKIFIENALPGKYEVVSHEFPEGEDQE